jgi:hydrogenase nickel incorporation protein HypB
MCIDCGCVERTEAAHHHHDHSHDHGPKTVQIGENLLAKNDRLAAANRARFTNLGLLTLNLVSSPGSGKTTLLETTLRDLRQELRFAVLEGDQQTANDADRIAATGVPAYQINTGAGCHLDAHMVGHGVDHFDLNNLDVLMIENVGNLVCPAAFDLGEDYKVAVLSITEGEDKPQKYPQMFRAAELVIVNKLDLLPYLDFDLDRCRDYIRQVNPKATVLELSCKSGEGMESWYNWLRMQVSYKRPS